MMTSRTFGSALLVAGTAIGAGMLALPIATGLLGILNATLLFLVCFFFMLLSLFVLLEVNLWSEKKESNVITIAGERLGLGGQLVAWMCFLLLLYSVAAAYLSAGGSLIANVVNTNLLHKISPNIGILIFVLVFGMIVVFETKWLDRMNRLLIFGLVISFVLLIAFNSAHVKITNFTLGEPKYIFGAIPIIILSFTSHIIVPSLRSYLHGDLQKIIKALFWGSLLPLIFYLIWEVMVLGVLPSTGDHSLEAVATSAYPVATLTEAMSHITGFNIIGALVGFFSFFALVTSFFGVSLSLYDFLSDGLRISKKGFGKVLLLVLMYVPPLIFALFYPAGFVVAIGYAGVFVAILYGILPVIMVWKGRYLEGIQEPFRVKGGKAALIFLFIGSLVIIFFQIATTNGLFPQV